MSERDSVELSCDFSQSPPVSQCDFFFGREAHKHRAPSCQLSLTGEELMRWSGLVSLPAVVKVKCSSADEPSQHSHTVSLIVKGEICHHISNLFTDDASPLPTNKAQKHCHHLAFIMKHRTWKGIMELGIFDKNMLNVKCNRNRTEDFQIPKILTMSGYCTVLPNVHNKLKCVLLFHRSSFCSSKSPPDDLPCSHQRERHTSDDL